jgi:hypothetical protein
MNPICLVLALLLAVPVVTVAQYNPLPNSMDKDGILRDRQGRVHFMTHYVATGVDPRTGKKIQPDVCAAFGGRLPTIRELAQMARSSGAKGIVKECTTDDRHCYENIDITNPDYKEDHFFYSATGYKRPSDDRGRDWFWSSSVYTFGHNYESSFYAYYFQNVTGYIGLRDRDYLPDNPDQQFGAGVRCKVPR